MKVPPIPPHELERLRSLHSLEVLDTPAEREFDAIVRAAALVCGAPMSLIGLIDVDRQWFKAKVGLGDLAEAPREQTVCAHAILQPELFEVPDLALDDRFIGNPMVDSANARFYAGVPLTLSDGSAVGTLCVIDREPRRLDDKQREILGYLAKAAVEALEVRRAAIGNMENSARFKALGDAAPIGIFTSDAHGKTTFANARLAEIYGIDSLEQLGHSWQALVHPEDRERVLERRSAAATEGQGLDIEYRIQRNSDGAIRHLHVVSRPVLDRSGTTIGNIGCVEDATERVIAERIKQDERERFASIIEGTGAGTWEYNLQSGDLIFNEQWANIIGYTLAELGPTSQATWRELVHPADLPRTRVAMQRHRDGQTPRYECEARLRHRDGHWVWVMDRGRIMTRTADGEPEWMFGTLLDVTARKVQEEALAKSELLLTRTGMVAGVGGWEFDLVSNKITWSDQTCRIYGLPPGHRPELDEALQYYTPEGRIKVTAAIEKAVQDGSGWDLELPFNKADGTSIWVRTVGTAQFENGKPVRLVGAFQDVSERVKLRLQLEQQHEMLRVTLQSIGDAVITTDAAGIVTWLNPVAERMTGWTTSEALGRPLLHVFHIINENSRRLTDNPVTACLEQGKIVGTTHHPVLIARDGSEYGIEESAAPIRADTGETLGVVLVFRDVTEQRRLSGEMSYRATHDALTGLVNRVEFESRLRRALSDAQQHRSEHSLMYLDLDQFKIVNDSCGHSVGDQLLQQVAKLLVEGVRGSDTLARLGGDEFAIILEHCTTEQAARVADKLCERMDQFRFVHDQRRFRIGASIGLVPVDARWTTTAAVMQAADSSCYAAKEAGRNRVHLWYDTDAAVRTRHGEMNWATRLEQALDEERFVLYAQRIHALDGRSDGLYAEVLLRFVDHDGTLVPPGAFLPAAERFHLSARIDRWVLRQVVERLGSLHDLTAVETLCVNLSGRSIGDRAFHRDVIHLLSAAGEAVCRRVCLEVTETAAITNMADAAQFIEQVRSLGVRVALDDFGAGASSFGYLNTLTVDLLKIDGQFIHDLLEDPLHDVAVRCFVDVARVIGVPTVAEFVDRAEVLARIHEIGIDYAQGFLLHQPEPIEQVVGGLTQRHAYGLASGG